MLTTILAALAGFAITQSSSAAEHPVDALVEPYLAAQQALSNDDLDSARASAVAFAQNLAEIAKIGGPWNTPGLHEAADSFAVSADMTAARRAFSELSAEMLALIQQQGPQARRELLALECSMAFNNQGAMWLQAVEATANPYFGASMRRCGRSKGRYLAGLGYFTQADLERIHGEMPGFETPADSKAETSDELSCGMSCCADK